MMGCIICNILEISGRYMSYEKCKECARVEETELDMQLVAEEKEEMCNDIAINHPEMVKRILEIFKQAHPELNIALY